MFAWEEYENRKMKAFKEIEEAARQGDLGRIVDKAIIIREIEQQLIILNNDRIRTPYTETPSDCP